MLFLKTLCPLSGRNGNFQFSLVRPRALEKTAKPFLHSDCKYRSQKNFISFRLLSIFAFDEHTSTPAQSSQTFFRKLGAENTF